MLAYIYSYCDAETLAALSLVSFGSWQTAGPILYETVEVRSLDSLKSLFFLVSSRHELDAACQGSADKIDWPSPSFRKMLLRPLA